LSSATVLYESRTPCEYMAGAKKSASGSGSRFFGRLKQQTARIASAASAATPPSAPPTMAPTGIDEPPLCAAAATTDVLVGTPALSVAMKVEKDVEVDETIELEGVELELGSCSVMEKVPDEIVGRTAAEVVVGVTTATTVVRLLTTVEREVEVSVRSLTVLVTMPLSVMGIVVGTTTGLRIVDVIVVRTSEDDREVLST